MRRIIGATLLVALYVGQISPAAAWVADGYISGMTLAAVRGINDRAGLVNRLCGLRLRYLRGFSTWDAFGLGWTRRVERVRADALRMFG